MRQNVGDATQATADSDFQRRAKLNLDFHRILSRMTDNPLMVIIMDGMLKVLSQYILSLGEYENSLVLPSRKCFLKHMEGGDVEAAVDKMEASLKRLQASYLSYVDAAARPAATGSAAKPRKPRVSSPAN